MYCAHVPVSVFGLLTCSRHGWICEQPFMSGPGFVCLGTFVVVVVVAWLQQGSHCLIQCHSLFVLLPWCQPGRLFTSVLATYRTWLCRILYIYRILCLWEPLWELLHLGEWMSVYCRAASVRLSKSQRLMCTHRHTHTWFCSNVGGLLCCLCSRFVHEHLPHSSDSRFQEILCVSNSWVRKAAQSHGNTNPNEEHLVNTCTHGVCNAALRHSNSNTKMEERIS